MKICNNCNRVNPNDCEYCIECWQTEFTPIEDTPFYNSVEEYAMSQKEDIEQIKEDIREIKENHLATMCNRIRKLENKFWYIVGIVTVIGAMTAAILQAVLR